MTPGHMSFGDEKSHAVVFYDRGTKVCVVVANGTEHLSAAVSAASATKADTILIVAPEVPIEMVPTVTARQELLIYELRPKR